jgi:hypothetical protein
MISTSKKIMANERVRTYCLFLCILPLTIFGCQSISVLPTEDVTTQATPYIHAGPLHVLLKMPTGLDKVKVLVDNTGLAHIFISSKRINEVHHVVLGSDGVVERELVKNLSSLDTLNLDAAFDRSGQLHVLIGREHMTKQEGNWVTVERTPWKEEGLTIRRQPSFVAGARDLTWAFLIEGQEVGTSGRWDWFGVAGGYPPLGLFWPWHTQADKLIVVPEMAPTYTMWMVLEPESSLDTDFWAFGVNRQGAIQVVYEQSRTMPFLPPVTEVSHAKFVIEPDRLALPTASSDVTAPRWEHQQLQAIPGGRAIGSNNRPTFIYPPVSIAIDPDSGATLVVRRSGGFEEFFQLREAGPRGFLVRDEEWSAAIPMTVSNVMKTSVAPSGNDRFHAVVVGEPSNFLTGGDNPIYYLNLTSNVWSPPVTLGLANNSHWIFKDLVDSVEVASNGSRRAVVVWPTDEGIVGRWIEVLQ